MLLRAGTGVYVNVHDPGFLACPEQAWAVGVAGFDEVGEVNLPYATQLQS